MTNHREILRLKSLGYSNFKVAEIVNCSRTTVIKVVRLAEEKEISYESVLGLSDKKLAEMLSPPTSESEFVMPDYEKIHKMRIQYGTTLETAWCNYCNECREDGKTPYMFTQFKKYYKDYYESLNITMHLEHKPGEIMQVDWAGDTGRIIDIETGELIPVYLFVATLPYSGYCYVEGFFSMAEEEWITAHVHAFNYFGGVVKIIQCDNLKTGVIKNTKDEVVINKSYQNLAEHYKTAIIPTRIRAPKDKAAVEGSVGIVTRFIIKELRKDQFFTLAEFNQVVMERLELLNNRPFQKKEGCRASVFIEEKEYLRPLPLYPYEFASWKVATVGTNYHISVDRMYYSVPYKYIRKKVNVKLTKSMVEIFFEDNKICSHKRIYGRPYQYSTLEEHMPKEHVQYLSWNGEHFRNWASKIGPNTLCVVKSILSERDIEQQSYKSCIGLLKLADKYSPQRLEAACKKSLNYTTQPSLKTVRAILSSNQDQVLEENKSSFTKHTFVRGYTNNDLGGKK